MLRIILLSLLAFPAFSQKQVSWMNLSDVQFTEEYSEEEEAYFYFPRFGPSVQALEGQEIILNGYILVFGTKDVTYILSSNPYSSCFFCGSGGPESIVQLNLQTGHPKFQMDDLVTVRGTLVLNDDDINKCNYILEDAVSVDQ